ncbi:hypothetical protein PUN28_012372 [Cardiocondyla obscurior]|uniref:Uncharacterized protein n=1 Tax=Cardiocondyla obscurior TaxID=286306 RepID=A0AAW2FGP7_9HYME
MRTRFIFNHSYQTIVYKAYKFHYYHYERLCITFRKFRYRFSCEYSNFLRNISCSVPLKSLFSIMIINLATQRISDDLGIYRQGTCS